METIPNAFRFSAMVVVSIALVFGSLHSNSCAEESSDKSVFQAWDASQEKSKRLAEVITALDGEAKLRASADPRGMPEIYGPSPDDSERFVPREKTLIIGDAFNTNTRKDEYIAFICAPHDDVFFVKHLFESRIESERVFGPFSGNPIKQFPEIERHWLKDLSAGDTNPFLVMRRIARVGHPELNARVVKLIDKALFLQMDFKEKLGLVRSSKEILAINRAQVEEQSKQDDELAQCLLSIRKKLERFQEQADDLTLEIPDEDYTTAKDMANVPREEVEESLWGKPVDGLRFAVVPETTRLKLEKQAHVKLVVENVADKEIKFCVHDLIQDVRPEVTYAGKRVRTSNSWFSGWPPTNRYRLKPGDRITLAGSHIVAYSESADEDDENLSGFGVTGIPVSGKVISADMSMKVDYTMHIGYGEAWTRCEDDVMRICSPAKGEWTGRLEAGGFEINFER